MSEFGLPSVAVVIPALDEEAVLAAALASLRNQTVAADRVIVVDGGSRDRSPEIAREFGADVLTAASAGRGRQIAAGVAAAAEDVIVVGHADMIFTRNALEAMRRHLVEHPKCPGGSLGHRFASRRWAFRVIEWFDARRGLRGHSYGDQAQFFRRRLVTDCGGFPEQVIMEDVELAARLRALGGPVYLDCPVTVSTRRFDRHGLLRTLVRNWRFRRAYRRGGVAATQAIFERYYASRKDQL